MMKDITIGQYIPGNSVLHKSDPRTKILLTMLYMVVVFILSTYTEYLILIAFTLLSIVISNIPLRYTIKGLKPVLVIIIFTGLINIFMTKGRALFEFGFIHITYEGVDLAVKMALRLSLLIIGASLLTLTTTPIALTDGIEKLLGIFKRLGMPVHEIAMMMTIALRFIPTLLEETEKIMKAQASRGADFDTGNVMRRAKSFIPVLVPLFVSAFRRADELALAMEARCYRGDIGRTRMKQLKLSCADLYTTLVMMVLTGGVIFLKIL